MPLTKLSPSEQTAFLKLLLDSTLEGFFAIDAEGRVTLCNASGITLLGYDTAEDLAGRDIRDLLKVGEDWPMLQAIRTGLGTHVIHEDFLRGDGSRLPVEYRIQPILKDGAVSGAICTFLDITERLEADATLARVQDVADEALSQVNEQLRLAQKAGGIGVFSVPEGSDQVIVSEEFCAIFGVPTAPSLSLTETAKLVLEEDRIAQSTTQNRASGTTPVETEYRIRRQSDGEIRWIYRRAEFQRDATGNPLSLVGIVQDITERKTAALKLTDSQAYLSLILESALDYGIVTLDAEGCVVLWNAGAQRIYGYAADEVIGRFADFMQPIADRELYPLRQSLDDVAVNGRTTAERFHMRKNGDIFFINGTLSPMHDDTGQLRGYIVITRDRTQQRQAQDALMDARNAAEAANIAKTEFLANMSHEIRTPMNAIIGLSTILASSQPLTDRQREFIRTLQTSADSLLVLINDLLDIAKIEARSVELEYIPFSLGQMVQEVISMMSVAAREKRLDFTGDTTAIGRRLHVGDPTRLRQVIVNLCGNAIKFTDQGFVRLSVTAEPLDDDRDMVVIRVADSGIGIPADKVDGIFNKFVQADASINRKYGGTGLGLAITRTLTEIMGGTITLDTTPNQGSVFEVRVPLTVAIGDEMGFDAAPLGEWTRSGDALRPIVLLVEDYEPNILVAGAFLDEFGYRFDVARNGMEAFEKVKETPYAAVLMDVQMHGMNGLDATRAIRQWEAQTGTAPRRIVGMTAHALAGDRERCLGVGMDDYIAKPFHPDDLRRKLQGA